ncbi:MAG TPA: hypothetical protein VIY30_15325, partial [Burkholderiaceae bacterium]
MKQNHFKSWPPMALVLFGVIRLSACGGGHDDSTALPDASACTPADSTFCRGKANFHDRALAGLGGNGRACSDCHMDSENFQLTPAAAQARFAQM